MKTTTKTFHKQLINLDFSSLILLMKLGHIYTVFISNTRLFYNKKSLKIPKR